APKPCSPLPQGNGYRQFTSVRRREMKRTGGLSTRLLIVAAVIALALGTGITGVEGARTLNLFNWSDYIPQDVLEDFEQEFGVRVNHDTYSNNEEMMAKLLAGGIGLYDIAVP